MKKLATWGSAFALLTSIVLAACGGSGSNSDTAQVRVINATQTHASLSLLVNASTAISAVAANNISAYSGVTSGSPTLQLNDATTNAVLGTTAPSLAKDSHYAILAYEQSGTVRVAIISEDTTAPAAGVAIFRVFNAATDAGAVDVYITDPSVDITGTTPTFTLPSSTQTQTSANQTVAPGTYRVRVTGQGNTTDLRLDIPTVTVTSQQLATVILTPSTGGTLVNGAALIQQGGYGAAPNLSARLRLLADVGGAATVAATDGSTTLSSGVASPAVGAYALVSTTATPAVTVNGTPLAPPATLPVAGSDSTLVVYGNSVGTATASIINDDNHLPVTTTALKIRLFNGLTGATSPLTLTADFSQIAVNIAPGKASAYSTLTPSTTLRLEVMSNNGTVYVESLATPPTNAVYTLFLLGDASAPTHLLRRDH